MSAVASPFSSSLRRFPAARFAIHFALVVVCLVFVFPILWMLSTSLKPIEQIMVTPPRWIPETIQPSNYVETVRYIPFWAYTKNTLVACVLSAFGTTLSSALVAYSFTRLQWPGKNILFGLTLATMMVPFPVLMVPLYTVFKSFGWLGSLKPLWVPSFFGSAFNIFLLRQFFLRIPKNLSEAMMLDGASELTIFVRVYLPLSTAPLAVAAFFQFIYTWNDFIGPLLYLTDQNSFTLSLGLQFYQNQLGGTQWHYLMAASFLTTLPILILFFFMQRSFLTGLSLMKNVDA
ncbi:MAG TPA: carbohydrate ABC transporter permease [Polyangiaceae bacterium]|nr:carbohydrate ABC transporter permease [Polyangiaceae bacterium]